MINVYLEFFVNNGKYKGTKKCGTYGFQMLQKSDVVSGSSFSYRNRYTGYESKLLYE